MSEDKPHKADNITDLYDDRSAIDDVIDAVKEAFPLERGIEREDKPYTTKTMLSIYCPKCKKRNFTARPTGNARLQYYCRECKNKWRGGMASPGTAGKKIYPLSTTKEETPFEGAARDPNTIRRV